MSITIDMKGKAAVVTGAASGLGRATAQKLAEAGANLCLVDLNEAGLAETQAMLTGSGTDALLHVADLSNPAACRAPVTAAVERFGRLDALCNVAGIIIAANAHEMPPEQWDKIIAINLTAPFLLSQAAIPHLIESEGSIVNVASSAAFIGEAYAVGYCASKSGLVGMTKALAMEYMHKPIRINAVAPGGMMTNIGANFRPPDGFNLDLLKRYSGMRGLVEVDDVADMICLLASDAGRGYHGTCVTIDRGITAG